MKLPTRKEVENDAIQFANSSPRPATFVNGWMKCYERFIEPLMQVNGAETSQDKALNLADVKANVISDINKMIEEVEGWINKDTSRRDKYLIHGQADGMRKAIHIIHQHLP